MSTKVEKLEKSLVKLTIEVPADKFDQGMTKAYHAMKSKINIPGFRKGKAPRALIEKTYGEGVFYDEAINNVIPEAIDEAVKENNINIAAKIDFDNHFNIISIGKSEPFVFEVTVTVAPEVTLGEYKGLNVEVTPVAVTDEEVDAKIAAEQEKNAREISISDRAVEPQDKVTIDFEGFVDGVAFEGGKGENHDLVIGSKSFIDNFEDQLIGKKVDEEVEVNVTFPEEYHSKELAGKPAMFKVKINAITIKELPELNDDFAADVSDFETLVEYKEDIKAKLQEEKANMRASEIENLAVQKAIDNATIEVPVAMIDEQAERNVNDFSMRMRYQGLDIESYLQYTNQTMDALKENFKADAEMQIKSRFVLEAIVKAENITISDEEVAKEIEDLAGRYNMPVEELAKSMGAREKEMLADDLKVQKAIKLVADAAVVAE